MFYYLVFGHLYCDYGKEKVRQGTPRWPIGRSICLWLHSFGQKMWVLPWLPSTQLPFFEVERRSHCARRTDDDPCQGSESPNTLALKRSKSEQQNLCSQSLHGAKRERHADGWSIGSCRQTRSTTAVFSDEVVGFYYAGSITRRWFERWTEHQSWK